MSERLKVALLGAGGKMGCRITDNIRDLPEYDIRYVEISEAGQRNLAQRGLSATEEAVAISDADVVVLALPDRLIGTITKDLVPRLRPGVMLVSLDPAAAHAGVIPIRDDLTYFVAHPCHPPLFNDETRPEAMTDWFGGIHAKQHIVCALHYGPDDDYQKGEQLARAMYAPVLNSYRVTVEQMAILEPALVETVSATLVTAMKEALDVAVDMGVPEEAAREFFFGHVRIELAVVFGYTDFPFSDGAKVAIAEAYDKIFKPDWLEQVMDRKALKESVNSITGAGAAAATGD